MVANAGIILMKSFVESLFYILLADSVGVTFAPYKLLRKIWTRSWV